MVEREQTLGIDDLLRQIQLEERVYRHRCVEAWSMAVPWSGFPLRALVDLARPSAARNTCAWRPSRPGHGVRSEAVLVPVAVCRGADHGRGDARARVPRHRPVRQADRAAERRAAAPRGAVEVRLQIDQVDRPLHLHRPAPEKLLGRDPGHRVRLWANVNPEVPHPRWSQAEETPLGSSTKVPTVLFNGYGEFVADLYKGLESEPLFM